MCDSYMASFSRATGNRFGAVRFINIELRQQIALHVASDVLTDNRAQHAVPRQEQNRVFQPWLGSSDAMRAINDMGAFGGPGACGWVTLWEADGDSDQELGGVTGIPSPTPTLSLTSATAACKSDCEAAQRLCGTERFLEVYDSVSSCTAECLDECRGGT
jgi:hypothetical protein